MWSHCRNAAGGVRSCEPRGRMPAAAPQPPVIVLPGILATALHDLYPIDPDEVWSAVLKKEYARIALHPDDVRYEAREPARVTALNPFGIVYGDLIESLRHELTIKADEPTPVFGFGYDWRQDCARTAAQLGRVRRRGAGENRAAAPLQGAAARRPSISWGIDGRPRDRRLPLRTAGAGTCRAGTRRVDDDRDALPGSRRRAPEALERVSGCSQAPTRSRASGRPHGRSRALYQMLPSYTGGVPIDAGIKAKIGTDDLFDMRTWQPSILETLCRVHPAPGRTNHGPQAPRQHLDRRTRLHRRREWPASPSSLASRAGRRLAPDRRDRREDVRQSEDRGRRERKAELRLPRGREQLAERRENRGQHGAVPRSAVPDFLEKSQPRLRDRGRPRVPRVRRSALLIDRVGFHAALPKLNHVQKLTARFLRDDLGWKLKGRRAPGVTRPRWPSWLSSS